MATPKLLDPRRTLDERRQAVVNLRDFLLGRGIAEHTRTPGEVVDTGRARRLTRYTPRDDVPVKGLPVLLVPPLGSQSLCFDLRRGCSVAEHLVESGRPTYLVDYDNVTAADRDLGIEHWISDVLPAAIRRVSDDHGGQEVHVLGWCMGGLISLGTAAAWPELPIRSVAMVASPFDMSKIPVLRPVRAIGRLSRGRIVGTGLRGLGSVPAPLVSVGFKATAIPTYLKKPMTLWKHRDNRDFLGQVQAVDVLMNNMLAYPGRATMQVYQRMAIRNQLATGTVQGPNRLVDLATVEVPVMNVAGVRDVLAPPAAAHHVGELLTRSVDVRLPLCPGGHLGVLTGTAARETTWREIDRFLDDHTPSEVG